MLADAVGDKTRRGRGSAIWGRDRIVTIVCLCGLIALCASTGGCGGHSSSRAVAQIFVDLATRLAPMPVYGLAELPPGASVPEEWWPVVEMEAAEYYDGPTAPNPRILDAGESDGEAQLVLEDGGGTMVILENFRGDLGNVNGVETGVVAGHTARLYEVNGGLLVQWSDGGRWYGVFARGVPEEDVVATALQMKVVPAESAE
jgi:hypothetical protein